MGKRTGPTNPLLQVLINDLKAQARKFNSPFLMALAEKLNKPRRQRVEVNIAHIERFTEKGDTVIIPGVVLGYGELSKPITVSAWKFSKPALEKIRKSKSQPLTIKQLIEKNPKGTNVKILS